MANQDIDIKIVELDEIKKALASLPKAVNAKAMKTLNFKSGKIAQTIIANAVPDGNSSKKAKQKLSSGVIVTKSNTDSGAYVGFKNSAFVAFFLSEGTKQRTTLGKGRKKKYKAGANRGHISPRNFIKKAFDDCVKPCLDYVSANALKIINQSLKSQLGKVK